MTQEDDVELAIILGAITIFGGLLSGAGAVVSAYGEKEAAQEAIAQKKAQAEIDKRAREAALAYNKSSIEQQRTSTIQTMADQLAIDKESALAKASDIEKETELGFTGAMESTYLGQLSAEAGYTDMLQTDAESLGGLKATNAISGTKQSTTVREVISGQLAAKEQNARTQIDQGVENAVTTSKGQADLALGQAGRIRSAFDSGSTYMNYYNNRISAINTSANAALANADTMDSFATESYDSSNTYLDDLYADYDSTAWTVGAWLGAGSGLGQIAQGTGMLPWEEWGKK